MMAVGIGAFYSKLRKGASYSKLRIGASYSKLRIYNPTVNLVSNNVYNVYTVCGKCYTVWLCKMLISVIKEVANIYWNY